MSQLKVARQRKNHARENPVKEDVNVLCRSPFQLGSALANDEIKVAAKTFDVRTTTLLRGSECREGGRTRIEPTGEAMDSAANIVEVLSGHIHDGHNQSGRLRTAVGRRPFTDTIGLTPRLGKVRRRRVCPCPPSAQRRARNPPPRPAQLPQNRIGRPSTIALSAKRLEGIVAHLEGTWVGGGFLQVARAQAELKPILASSRCMVK
jgi:hypothetical protein